MFCFVCFFRQGQGSVEPSLAPWRSGTKVGKGGARPGRQTVCVRCTMPALQSVSSVLSAKQTLHFPLGLAALAIFSSPIKVRRAWADKESFLSHLNNENPNRSAASAPPSSLSVKPSNILSVGEWCCHGTFTPHFVYEFLVERDGERQKQSASQS